MALQNLLVAFNGAPSSEHALAAGTRMAQKYGAHLTGLLAHEGQRDRFANRPWLPDNVRDILETAIHEREAEVETAFRAQLGDTLPPDRVHWITLPGDPDATVAQYANMYDVTIVGRHTLEDAAEASLHPERIALLSGRPVLMVPDRPLDPDMIQRRAVLAWDGHRAATRAMHDAMTILETKTQVDVLSVGDHVRKPLPGIDAVTTLARHGVPATRVRRPATARNAGQDILDYCAEVDAGVLVMGAFEHSALRESLFGGATKYVLEHAHLPVLMSH